MLSWVGVTKIFKSDLLSPAFTALDDVSFQVPAGSMVGFLGANGAGKTTSIKIALDFTRPTRGRVEYGAELGQGAQRIFQNVGFLPERPYYYPHLRGEEFVHFMGGLSGLSTAEIRERLPRLAQRFRLDQALKRELKTYSKGMLQRIGFLVTVLHRPKLIILDEPLSGLDPLGRKELKDIIVDIHREGCTVFFSSHIVSDVEEICDRTIFLRQGKLVYDGPVQPLLQQHSRPSWRVVVPTASGPSTVPLLSRTSMGSGLDVIEVATAEKDRLLAECVSRGVSIMGVEQQRPRLEEIFYHSGEK